MIHTATKRKRDGIIVMSTPEIVEVLKQNPIFGKLEENALTALSNICEKHSYGKGKTVIVEGELGDRMFVILRGELKFYATSSTGETIELSRRKTADCFGEMALVDGGPRSASVETVTPSVLLEIQRPVFIGLLEREPKLIEPLMVFLGGIARNQLALITDLAFLDLRGRLARKLLDLGYKDGGDGSLTKLRRVSQTDLARMVNAARQTVNTLLHSMAHEKLISIDDDGIRILQPDELRKLTVAS
jgi:CRP/FNR family transcriptional regulator, cyclic AMP receptor protein